MHDVEHPTWDTLAKVSTVAEQMRRRAESAETESTRLADAQNEYWVTIERLEAQLAGAVEALEQIKRVAAIEAQPVSEEVAAKVWRIAFDALNNIRGR